ncbi:MAG: tail protein X [Thermoguttaceae bacterium]|jgi:nucleoid-associated protein YgaU
MDQRIRIAAAVAVLVGGLSLALLFRHPDGRSDVPIPAGGDQLVLHKRESPAVRPQDLTAPSGTPKEPSSSPTMLRPTDGGAAAPDLARLYPAGGSQATSRWGFSMGLDLPGRPPAPVTHKIVDGDTLPALAQRYLGSADRASEIFEANRGILADPRLLPIGCELKIPPRPSAARCPAPAAAPPIPQPAPPLVTPGRLVPVTP